MAKILPLILGWVFSRFGLSPLRGYCVEDYTFLPGFIFLLALIFYLSAYVFGKECKRSYVLFFVGVIADSLVYWIMRPRGDLAGLEYQAWSMQVSSASIIVLLIAIILVLFLARFQRKVKIYRFSRYSYFFSLSILTITIVFFRFAYFVTANLPNEDRSLFIAGFEIHHAVTGSFFLLLLAILVSNKILANSRLLLVLFSIILGFIFDQFSYLHFNTLSDLAYGGKSSFAGAIIGLLLYIVYLFILDTYKDFENGYK